MGEIYVSGASLSQMGYKVWGKEFYLLREGGLFNLSAGFEDKGVIFGIVHGCSGDCNNVYESARE